MKLYCELSIITLQALSYRFVIIRVIFVALISEKYYSVFLALEIRVDLLLLLTHNPFFNVDQAYVYLLEVGGYENYDSIHNV